MTHIDVEGAFADCVQRLGGRVLDREGHVLDCQGVFLPNVDITLVGADGKTSDDQPFED